MNPTLEAGIKAVLSPARADGLPCSAELYRFAAGEASLAEAEAFRAHLRSCEYCRQDLAAFERDAAKVESTATPRGWWSRNPLRVLVGVAAATSLFLGIWYMRGTKHDFGGELRVMGGYRLHVAVQRGERSFTAGPEDRFVPGDMLGFFYTAPAPTYLTLYLAEPNGKIARILPQSGAAPSLQPAATQARLEFGAEVDSSSQCQWLVAFFAPADSAPQFAELESALRQSLVSSDESNCQIGSLAPKGVATDIVTMKIKTQ